MVPADMEQNNDPLVGMTVQDYVLQRVIGRGAMATVYLGRHAQTGQLVAIKFLAGEFSLKEDFVTRFVREAEACASLDHENIMHVYSSGEEAGLHYMVLEYVEGFDLSHYLEVQDRVKESQALPWMKQCGRALAYAHRHGIIHRDLKPENIMVSKDGLVKIADLGLSKNLGMEAELSMTGSGSVIGTPYYIAPEQARDSKHVDPRADIYSLGATFYHLLTGRPPFEGNSAAEVMANHMSQALTNPQRLNRTLGDGICDLISKMMEKDVSNRFQSMEELIEAIERVEHGQTAIPGKIKLKPRDDGEAPALLPVSLKKLARPLWIWSGGGALAVLAVIYLMIFSGHPSPKPDAICQIVASQKPPTPPAATLPDEPLPSPDPAPPSTAEQVPPAAHAAEATQPPTIEVCSLPPEFTGKSSGFPKFRLPRSFNWVDALALLFILLGIPAAQQVGVVWGTVRAATFWIAVTMFFWVLEPVSLWITTEIKFPQPGAGFIAFCLVSILFLLPAWILTHRLRIYERNSVTKRVERTFAILPGIVLGAAFATVIMAFLSIILPQQGPVTESWMGSWVQERFPSIRQINPSPSGKTR